jgi:hypothetical protein
MAGIEVWLVVVRVCISEVAILFCESSRALDVLEQVREHFRI